MSRYDKYDPVSGGFRAPLNADVLTANGFVAYGVGLNSSGNVVLGAGVTGIVGVFIAHGAKKAGDIIDVQTSGEIVEFPTFAAPGAAGTVWTADTTTGDISTTAADATHIRVGFTADAGRLVVRV